VFIVFATCIFVTFDQRKLANAVQKQLTQRVIETQERERSRLARELHDGISQELLGVRYAMELAGRRAGDVSPELNRAIEETISTLNTTIREIRNISHDLRPRVLDDIGLVAAIKNLSEKFSARSGVAISVDADGFVDDLVPDARTALFRVTQEALSNVERHAGASRVALRLWNERGRTRMQISDDGRGVDFSRTPQARGLGMENMRERIGHFGGVLLIDGDANGMRLLLMLPRSASQPVADSGAAA
jgi:two-component system NarL family sensor kinase